MEQGAEVYWNDPDNGQCSGWRVIQDFVNEDIARHANADEANELAVYNSGEEGIPLRAMVFCR